MFLSWGAQEHNGENQRSDFEKTSPPAYGMYAGLIGGGEMAEAQKVVQALLDFDDEAETLGAASINSN